MLENSDHIFVSCPRECRIWRFLHTTVSEGLQRQPWCIGLDLDLPAKVIDVMLISLWHIWKARNAMIFNDEDVSPTVVLCGIINDLDHLAFRYKRDRGLIGAWNGKPISKNVLVPCNLLTPPPLCIFCPWNARSIWCNLEPVLMGPSFSTVNGAPLHLVIEKKTLSDRGK